MRGAKAPHPLPMPYFVAPATPAQRWGGSGGAVLRTLSHVTLPRWRWSANTTKAAANVSFYSVLDDSTEVVLKGHRGEGLVMDVFRILCRRCARAPSATVLDIGTNLGLYSMLAAAHGCRVVSFEPQPGCASYYNASRARNGLPPRRARFVARPVGAAGRQVEIHGLSCWSMATPKRPARVPREHMVRREATEARRYLREGERVLLAKVDVEGGELEVLRSLGPTLGGVENLIVETSPGWWRRGADPAARNRSAGAELYASLLTRGGGGFVAALTSTGRLLLTPAQLQQYLMGFPQKDGCARRAALRLRPAKPRARACARST